MGTLPPRREMAGAICDAWRMRWAHQGGKSKSTVEVPKPGLMRGGAVGERSEVVMEMAGRWVPSSAYRRRASAMGMASSGLRLDGVAASMSEMMPDARRGWLRYCSRAAKSSACSKRVWRGIGMAAFGCVGAAGGVPKQAKQDGLPSKVKGDGIVSEGELEVADGVGGDLIGEWAVGDN